jgi:hypothetical protein
MTGPLIGFLSYGMKVIIVEISHILFSYGILPQDIKL